MSSLCLQHDSVHQAGAVTTRERRIADLSLLTPAEKQQVLVEWNKTQADFPQVCLHTQIEKQVEKTPTAVAVEYEEQRLPYAELNRRANQLARHLITLGIGLDARVGVCLERSLDMVVTLLAILKAGAAYLPLDPDHPRERLAYVVEHSGIHTVVTHASFSVLLPENIAHQVVLDHEWPVVAKHADTNPEFGCFPENVMYVLYTSGSTGTPKGVAIPHSALDNHMCWMKQIFAIDEGTRVLQKTPFGFDASVWEFYAPLLNGGTLVMARPGGHQDSSYLVRVVQEKAITMLQVVPSLLKLLAREPGFANCHSLRWLFSGGETLSVELAREVTEQLPIPLVNLYGPTEATIDTTYSVSSAAKDAMVSLGKPVSNAQLYVLDLAGQPAPVEVAGELYIGGAGLARGYLNQPELTAQRFAPNPFGGQPGARLYRTGDQVRWRRDGTLEFIGRLDHQVKLGGYRIELGEIEAVLRRHPGVEQSAVVVREDVPGVKRLVGYLQKKAGESFPNTGEIQDYLRQHVPEYMVPGTFVTLETIPLTNSGKVDRNRLPLPQTGTHQSEYVAPRNQIEERLCAIWSKVLGIERIGVEDNFFELGGHSILAIQIISLINQAFELELSMRYIFQESTVSGLAVLIEETLIDKIETETTPEVSPDE